MFGGHGRAFYGVGSRRRGRGRLAELAIDVRPCSRYARDVPSRLLPVSLNLRVRACALCLAVLLALAGGGAAATAAMAANLGNGGALNQLTEGEPEETKTSTTTSSTGSSEPTNNHTVILLALVAAVLLLSGIAFVIVRDARRVAPATEREMIQGSSASDTAVQLRKRRAKAKAARKQRKRNR